MSDDKPKFNKRPQEKLPPQVLEEMHNMPQGATWGGEGRVLAEREQDLRNLPLSQSGCRVFWGSQAKIQLSFQAKDKEVLVSSEGVLSMGHPRGRPGKALQGRGDC